jgi:hypothetical protein
VLPGSAALGERANTATNVRLQYSTYSTYFYLRASREYTHVGSRLSGILSRSKSGECPLAAADSRVPKHARLTKLFRRGDFPIPVPRFGFVLLLVSLASVKEGRPSVTEGKAGRPANSQTARRRETEPVIVTNHRPTPPRSKTKKTMGFKAGSPTRATTPPRLHPAASPASFHSAFPFHLVLNSHSLNPPSYPLRLSLEKVGSLQWYNNVSTLAPPPPPPFEKKRARAHAGGKKAKTGPERLLETR